MTTRDGAPRREGGFITLHRQILSSPLFKALSPEQRWVAVVLLLRANWHDSGFEHAGTWHPIARGELVDTLATIAGLADVSIKVVRTTLAKLMADDSRAGGRGPFLKTRNLGTGLGTGSRVLTIVNYDEFQAAAARGGTGSGTSGARRGHGRGTIQQVEPLEEGGTPDPNNNTSADAPGGVGGEAAPALKRAATNTSRQKKTPDRPTDPRQQTVAALEAIFSEALGTPYRATAGDAAQVAKLLAWPEATAPEIERRAGLALSDTFSGHGMTIRKLVADWPSWVKPRASSARPPPSSLLTEAQNAEHASVPEGTVHDF
ncbi:MAG TPA: hypothetical protein VGK67_26400 [Myxococcales bacterium]|jgi:hypothetical protein